MQDLMTVEAESAFKCGLRLSPCQAVEWVLLLSPDPDPADPQFQWAEADADDCRMRSCSRNMCKAKLSSEEVLGPYKHLLILSLLRPVVVCIHPLAAF